MVENRPVLKAIHHLVLILGVVAVAFPLYVTFIASTHSLESILSVPMPLLPGDQFWAITRRCSRPAPPAGRRRPWGR